MCYVFSVICIETIVLVYSNTNIKMFSQVQCTDTCLLCGHLNAIALTALKITVQMIIMGGRGTTLRSWTNLMNHTASSILLMCLWSFGFFFLHLRVLWSVHSVCICCWRARAYLSVRRMSKIQSRLFGAIHHELWDAPDALFWLCKQQRMADGSARSEQNTKMNISRLCNIIKCDIIALATNQITNNSQ